jgi:Fe-S-cluster containining protein
MFANYELINYELTTYMLDFLDNHNKRRYNIRPTECRTLPFITKVTELVVGRECNSLPTLNYELMNY